MSATTTREQSEIHEFLTDGFDLKHAAGVYLALFFTGLGIDVAGFGGAADMWILGAVVVSSALVGWVVRGEIE